MWARSRAFRTRVELHRRPSHKFLILGEAVHARLSSTRSGKCVSGKELSRLVTVKDPVTGKMQSRVVRTPVIVSSVMSGHEPCSKP